MADSNRTFFGGGGGGGSAYLDAPVDNWVTYQSLNETESSIDLYDGSVNIPIHPDLASWADGPDIELGESAPWLTITTGSLYLLTGTAKFSYQNDSGVDQATAAVAGYNTLDAELYRDSDGFQVAVPFRNATVIHNGWIDMTATLYIPAMATLSLLASSEVFAVSGGARIHTMLNGLDIRLTRYLNT